MKSLYLLFLATLLVAQSKDTKAPLIPLAAESEYYRADGVFSRAKAQADAASADLQAAVAVIQKLCGDKYGPYPADKHIICVPKPETPPAKP